MPPKWNRAPGRIEAEYRREVDRLLARYFRLPTAADLGLITARLVEWGQIDSLFRRYAERAASSMVTGVAVQNAANWRAAAAAGTQSREILAALRGELRGAVGRVYRARVKANADLIGSLKLEVARDVTAYVGQQRLQGQRATAIAQQIRAKMPELTRWRVQRIARTEVSKAETAMTRARAEDLRLNWYVWETSEDIRVRSSHRHMAGVLINWEDAPAPEALARIRSRLGHYHAGEAPNCRCLALPLLMLNEVRWPHKVHVQGRIVVMTKPQFLALAPGYRVAA